MLVSCSSLWMLPNAALLALWFILHRPGMEGEAEHVGLHYLLASFSLLYSLRPSPWGAILPVGWDCSQMPLSLPCRFSPCAWKPVPHSSEWAPEAGAEMMIWLSLYFRNRWGPQGAISGLPWEPQAWNKQRCLGCLRGSEGLPSRWILRATVKMSLSCSICDSEVCEWWSLGWHIPIFLFEQPGPIYSFICAIILYLWGKMIICS